jgi:Leucine-rich repeat (LRR) protein
MRRLLGPCVILVAFGAFAPAADPTPEDAFKLLDKLKVRYRKDKKSNILRVDLARKKVTADDLKVIAALKTVRELELDGPILKSSGDKVVYAPQQIGDEALKNLAPMTALQRLSLDGTHVTDAGLKHLAGLKNLQVLVLSDTKVTDAGMEALTKLPKLEQVNVLNTKVTDEGIGVLKRWKPELKITR